MSVIEPLEFRVLLAAPVITTTAPADAGAGAGISAHISATFSAPVDPTTISGSTFRLRDVSGNSISGRVSYNATSNTATFDPASPLSYSTAYTATLVGGSAGVKDRASGTPLAANFTWSFQTALAPTQGPGGPILVIGNSANPFTSYYAEILRAEGLNEFATADISTINSTMLGGYGVVILGQTPLNASQVTTFSNYVNAGGDLIAMKPDKQLASLLGLSDANTALSNGYIDVNTGSGPGAGITDQTIQFHSAADAYTLNGASPIAMLYSSATTSTPYPAVTMRSVGLGRAAAFTYDLAQSIVYTRQGNPAWAGQDRDGISPVRSNDMFYGNASFDPQPDWIDLNKVAIPQADEQQRLLANMITQMEQDSMPLPRFWYFPNGAEAMILMTGDDHATGGTPGRFNAYLADGTSGGVPIRSTSYVFPGEPMTDAQVASYIAQGFEVALHVNTGLVDFTSYADLDADYSSQLASLLAQYPSLPTPSTERTHAIVWSDYATQPQVELAHRIRLDTNYYYYPPTWMSGSPGMFTGSGLPMRFATANGQMIDVYQATTQMTDESGQAYPFTVNALLDNATGPLGYYGVFTANMHTDYAASTGSDAIIASAQAHGVPVVSAQYVLNWEDGRNGSSFSNLSWNGSTSSLSFSIATGVGANGLQAMLPTHGPGGAVLNSISNGSGAVTFSTQVIKGIEYAMFNSAAGTYTARYSGSTVIIPTVTSQSPAPNAVGVATNTTASVTFNESVVANSISFVLKDASGNTIPATVTYNDTTKTATLTPTSSLAAGATYTATVSGAKDASGNTMAAPVTWSFTTTVPTSGTKSLWSPSATPANPSVSDASAVEVGVKFRSDVAGMITGIRFYKGSRNTGTHTGSLWSSTGTLLATATFTGETASGWQQVNFSTPVSIQANTTYVASYHTNTGFYAGDNNYFSTGLDNAPLHALSSSSSGGNGVYRYGASAFPNSSWNASNYWVDVVFSTGVDTTAPAVTAQTPAPNATNVGTSTAVTATFSESVVGSSITFTLKNASGTAVAGSTAYNDTTKTVTFTPTAALAAATTYTATVSGATDSAGNTMAGPVSWSFTTAAPVIPAVTAQTPSPNATGVATSTTVTATFNESVVANSISFTLKNSAGTSIAASVAYNDTTKTVTLTPTSALASSTTYTATVSGATDASGNSMTAPVTWSFTTAAPIIPTVTAQTPAPSATGISTTATVTATFNESVLANSIAFTLKDASGATIAATIAYNDTTKTATLTPSALLANSTTYTATVTGATDASGNSMAGPVTWSFTTAAAVTGTYSLWSTTAIPANPSVADAAAVELGVKFRSDVAGTITGIRFYKGSSNTGTHTGSLWTSAGTLLATATFTNETTTGWQQVTFASPVAIQANTVYVASYHTNTGFYAGDNNYFNNAVDNAPLHAPTSASAGGNGVYRYGASAFPNSTWNASNYWVDVVFTTGPDTTPPTITAQTPAPNATNIATGTAVTATFSESVQASTISFTLKNAAGTAIAGSTAYNDTTKTVTFTPTSPIAASTTYTATISSAKDTTGNTMTAPVSWSFTTAAPVIPAVTAQSPAPNATGVSTGTTVTATFNESVVANSITFTLKNASGTAVAGSAVYNDTTKTVTFTPTAALAAATTYTATLSGATDASGNTMTAPVTWSFTTAAANTTYTLFTPTSTPAIPSSNDATPIELGMKFTSDVAGSITGVRFYKATGDTGTHTAHLWSSTGQLLATATFTSETASGWQQVNFPTPVSIQPNTTYIVSYWSSAGYYADTVNYFGSTITSGPLHAPSASSSGGNGLYMYGASAFPRNAWNASNYWVDVVFQTA